MQNLGLILLIVFIIEFLSLFIFSQALTRSLTRLFYYFSRSEKVTIHLLALVFLPGTVIHELAHVISAGVMMVPTGEIEFMPQVTQRGVKLGSAQIGITDPIRRAIIGFAPVLVGLSLLLGSLFFISSKLTQGSAYGVAAWLIFLYVLFEISNTMFSSKKDLEGSAVFAMIIIGLFLGFYLIKFYEPFIWIQDTLNSEAAIKFLIQTDLFMLIPILIDIAIYLLVKLSLGGKFR